MRHVWGGMILAFCAAPALALNCEDAMTQAEMTQCAHYFWEEADKDLNAAYAGAMKIAEGWDNGADEALRSAQRAWIPYRDAACEAEGFLARGGTMEPMLVFGCKENLTRQRTENLRTVYQKY